MRVVCCMSGGCRPARRCISVRLMGDTVIIRHFAAGTSFCFGYDEVEQIPSLETTVSTGIERVLAQGLKE